jgi:Rrf2 family transcriptional regulator, iron-sulfur cluster assembly transcription factor
MFSKATEYALRATIFIAQKGVNETKIGIEEISKAIGSPPSFTAKILQILRKNNKVLHSVSGPNGGFFITEKARKQPVRSVIEAMNEGEILEKCVLGLVKCSELKPCPMHSQYKLIKAQLIELFESKTIQDLADDIKAGDVYLKISKR